MIEPRHLEVPKTARFYVLGKEGDAQDVWFVLHGYGQLAATFIEEFAVIAADSRLIVAPEALSRFYLSAETSGAHSQSPVGATWMTREDRETEIEDYVRYLDRLYELVRPAGKVRVLGFSQGTATASRWAAYGSGRVDELILWAGGVAEDLDLTRYAGRLGAMRVICVIGERDHLATADKVASLERRLGDAGLRAELIRFSGGHRLDRDTLRRIAEER